jgi:hypothetical protein
MTSSSLAGMHIQFRTPTFYSIPEEQLQGHLRLKKFVTSLSAVIGALGSHLLPHSKSDLATDLYSVSTLIANMDASDHQIIFNLPNKSVILLLVAIGASCSTLGPRLEKDLATDLYSGSTPIAIKDEFKHRIRFI